VTGITVVLNPAANMRMALCVCMAESTPVVTGGKIYFKSSTVFIYDLYEAIPTTAVFSLVRFLIHMFIYTHAYIYADGLPRQYGSAYRCYHTMLFLAK
jgi:hypothetical protein